MPTCRIDHITILAPTLAAGAELVADVLGVRPRTGGEHPRMGTHNLLLALGEAMFLEVIAINPAAPGPARPRWFGLDQLPADSQPCLGCWVARTEDIQASLAAASEPLGPAEPMSRGALDWLISIPEDGSLALGGLAPALIQWRSHQHPATGMRASGCRLVRLELLHPQPQRLRALIGSLQFADCSPALALGEAAVARLVAHIETPFGLRIIGAPAPAQPPPRLQGL